MKMENALKRIAEADDYEITEILNMLVRRQKELHPDWEGMYLSFPLKQPDECKRILFYTWDIINNIMDKQLG